MFQEVESHHKYLLHARQTDKVYVSFTMKVVQGYCIMKDIRLFYSFRRNVFVLLALRASTSQYHVF